MTKKKVVRNNFGGWKWEFFFGKR